MQRRRSLAERVRTAPGRVLEALRAPPRVDLLAERLTAAEARLDTAEQRAEVAEARLGDLYGTLSQTQSAALDLQRRLERARPSEALRIGLVSFEYPPAPCGGIGNWTHTLARGLVALGHRVHVVTPAAEEEAPSLRAEDGVWVSRIRAEPFFGRTYPPIPLLHPLLRDHVYAVRDEVVRLALEHGLDVVSTPIWNVEGAALVGAPPLPTAVSLHTTLGAMLEHPPDWVGSDWFPPEYADIQANAESWVLHYARTVVANTRAAAEDLASLHQISLDRAEIHIVPHGLDDDPAAYGPAHKPPGAPTEVLFLGRHEPRKGIDVFLDAVAATAPHFAHVHFTVAGEGRNIPGTSMTYAEAFTTRHLGAPWLHRVRFLGEVDEPTKVSLFRSCDIFAAPSRYESFGLVYLEAMRAGKPVLACRAGGAAEVVEDGVTGLLVPPGDAAGLAEALVTLIRDHRLRRAMGEAGRERFLQAFTSESMCHAFAAAMSACVRQFAAEHEAVHRPPRPG